MGGPSHFILLFCLSSFTLMITVHSFDGHYDNTKHLMDDFEMKGERFVNSITKQMKEKIKQGVFIKKYHEVKDFQSGCTCQKATYTCGCCLHMDAPKIKLNNTGCVNVSYLPDQYGISLTFSLDGKVYFNETVSARNPPPLCFGIPHFEKTLGLCIDFYNLDISNSTFSGCIKVEARLVHVIVQDYDLGCFHVPLRPGWQINQEEALKNWLNDMKVLMRKRRKTMFQQV